VREDLAGDVALEAAHDPSLGLALGGAAGDVVLGRLVAARADQGDAPQGAAGLPVPAVQPVPVGPAGRDRDRGGTAQPTLTAATAPVSGWGAARQRPGRRSLDVRVAVVGEADVHAADRTRTEVVGRQSAVVAGRVIQLLPHAVRNAHAGPS
jgi:hypothetical protein